MKTLFLIDGAYQEAKVALCAILNAKKTRGETYRLVVPNSWKLIEKYSTKITRTEKKKNDLRTIDFKMAEFLLNLYEKNQNCEDRINLRYFCYKYPELEGKEDYIYCIDTNEINNKIDDPNVEYGFLIVRNSECINDLIYKYEQNGRLNVVPVFLYTDCTYIKAANNQDNYDKWEKLWSEFVGSYQKDDSENRNQSGAVNYESVLIFNAVEHSGDVFDIASYDLMVQLKALVKQVENKNKDLVVVTENERTFIPEEIRGRKNDIEKDIGSPQQYRKNIFVMMKYHGSAENDDLYLKIKEAVESNGYTCIRADDEYINNIFPHTKKENKPSIVFWLATFLCGQGIAIFEKDYNGKIALNPNVAFEMGIMQQQGKHIEIFIPEIENDEKITDNQDNANKDLFFDIRDWWKNRYASEDELIKRIKQRFPKII